MNSANIANSASTFECGGENPKTIGRVGRLGKVLER